MDLIQWNLSFRDRGLQGFPLPCSLRKFRHHWLIQRQKYHNVQSEIDSWSGGKPQRGMTPRKTHGGGRRQSRSNQVDQREAPMRIIPAQWVSRIMEKLFLNRVLLAGRCQVQLKPNSRNHRLWATSHDHVQKPVENAANSVEKERTISLIVDW